jgi:hypothetical protein
MVIIRLDKSADLIDANNHLMFDVNNPLKSKGKWLIFLNLNMTNLESKEIKNIIRLFATSRPHDFNVLYSGSSKNFEKGILLMTDFIFKKSNSEFVITNMQGKIVKRFGS